MILLSGLGQSYERQYLLDTWGRCVSWTPGYGRPANLTNTPCTPGTGSDSISAVMAREAAIAAGTVPTGGGYPTGGAYGPRPGMPYMGPLLKIGDVPAWNPTASDIAFAELEKFRRGMPPPGGGTVVVDNFPTEFSTSTTITSQGGGTLLPLAPSAAPSLQVEEFQLQPEPQAFAPVVIEKKQEIPWAMLLAAGAVAFLLFKGKKKKD